MFTKHGLTVVDLAIAGLAIFALILLVISLVFELTPSQEELFGWIDLGVCAVFITELAFGFRKAPSKFRWLRESWADILGSIPTTWMEMRIIRGFRLFRATRVVRAARVARVTRVTKTVRIAKAAKALKLARKLPKLRKTVKKFRSRSS
jgi:voltage-gated potassium channel